MREWKRELRRALEGWAREDWMECAVTGGSPEVRREITWSLAYFRLRKLAARGRRPAILVLSGADLMTRRNCRGFVDGADLLGARPGVIVVHDVDRMSDRAQEDVAAIAGLADRMNRRRTVIYSKCTDLAGPLFESYLGVDVPVLGVSATGPLVKVSYSRCLEIPRERPVEVVADGLAILATVSSVQPAVGIWTDWAGEALLPMPPTASRVVARSR